MLSRTLIQKKVAIFACLVLLYLSSSNVFAQQKITRNSVNHLNTWFMYFGNHAINSCWGIHAEVQWRRHNTIQDAQQLLLRTGINFYPNQNNMLTLGYCFVQTYSYGELPAKAAFPENRFWQQWQLKSNPFRCVESISRFRLEQRFVYLPVLSSNKKNYTPGDAVYTNRFRLMHRISIPLRGVNIVDRSWYISAYDELFINFGKNVGANIFDQNRAYVAFGYKVPILGRLEVGYMHQPLFKSDGIGVENNHTLMIGLITTTSASKK